MLEVRRIGDWTKAKLVTSTMKDTIKASADPGFSKLALKGESLMRRYIVRQPSSWPSLNPRYRQAKIRAGKSDKTLVRTSSMLHSIKGFSANQKAYIGIKRQVKNTDGESVANIAAIMENGSKARNIPRRPFVRPVYSHLVREIQNKRLFERLLRNNLKRKYGLDV